MCQRSPELCLNVLLPAGCIKIVNLQGKLKSSKKLSAELTFNFQIESIGKPLYICFKLYVHLSSSKNTSDFKTTFFSSSPVCLQDSVLAFWRHGMQGRSFRSNEVIIIQSENRSLSTSLPCHNVCFFSADHSRDQ